MNNSDSFFARALLATGLLLSPYWTSWTPTSSRAVGASSSSSTRATEVSASWARTERRTGEVGLGSASPAWSPVKAATVRRNTRVSSHGMTFKPLNPWRAPTSSQAVFLSFHFTSVYFRGTYPSSAPVLSLCSNVFTFADLTAFIQAFLGDIIFVSLNHNIFLMSIFRSLWSFGGSV